MKHLYFQHRDGNVRHISDLKQFAASWGWEKSLFRGRILVVDVLDKNRGQIEGELSPHLLAHLTDDFLAARVYFGHNIGIFNEAIRKIPYNEQVVGKELSRQADET